MGLLDDAIREHLELKRLRGADPSDVARAEQVALGPVDLEDQAEPHGPRPRDAGLSQNDKSCSQDSLAATAGDLTGGQETVEINMEAELSASDAGHDSMLKAERTAPAAYPQASSEESLALQIPRDRPIESGTAGSYDGTDSGVAEELEANQVDDVLEETPDFLRDTPEQERLWFEQRPPRDFDFNE